jgi:hypothetical protein
MGRKNFQNQVKKNQVASASACFRQIVPAGRVLNKTSIYWKDSVKYGHWITPFVLIELGMYKLAGAVHQSAKVVGAEHQSYVGTFCFQPRLVLQVAEYLKSLLLPFYS